MAKVHKLFQSKLNNQIGLMLVRLHLKYAICDKNSELIISTHISDIISKNKCSTRLQITMEITTLVHISQSLKYLKAPIPDFNLCEGLAPFFHKLIKIALLTETKFIKINCQKSFREQKES